MSQRNALLEREKQKLTWLREKVTEQEKRIRTLEQMKDDPLDEAFEREAAVQIEAQKPQLSGLPQSEPPITEVDRANENRLVWNSWASRPPRQLPPKWLLILSFIGKEGKTYSQVKEFIQAKRLPITADAVRTGLMNYRKDFGFVDNPTRGFYVATDKALEAIKAQKGESLATDHSEASKTQPTPLERAAA